MVLKRYYDRTINRRSLIKTGSGMLLAGTLPKSTVGRADLKSTANTPGHRLNDSYRLPQWFDANRVQAHCESGLNRLHDPLFMHYAEHIRKMGANVFTRTAKATGMEGAWYHSSVGYIDERIGDRNVAKEIIDEAHRNGMRILLYHRHIEDNQMAKMHPEWVGKNPDGSQVIHPGRGIRMCFNTPFREFMLTRILELVDMGADGFYFDNTHNPPDGCWCDYCKKLFKERTGLSHPHGHDMSDPVYRKLIDFYNESNEDLFTHYRKAIHDRNPGVVCLISCTWVPTLSNRRMTTRLASLADSVKNEWEMAIRENFNQIFKQNPSLKKPDDDIRIALGYAVIREASGGRPPHLWAYRIMTKEQALSAAAAMLTHGCIANFDIPAASSGRSAAPSNIITEETINNPMFNEAFEMGNIASYYLQGTKLFRWIAIHFSEEARNRRDPDESRKWKEALYPFLGSFHVLTRARLPVGVINDWQLADGELNGYAMLVLPHWQELTNAQDWAVKEFEKRGGTVLRLNPAWKWHNPEEQPSVYKAFLKLALNLCGPSPVEVVGGNEIMHAVAWRHKEKNRLVIALCNDFTWFKKPDFPRGGLWTPDPNEIPPPQCTGVKAFIRTKQKPRKLWEGITGNELQAKDIPGGIEAHIPDFQWMSLVVVQY